jgi:pimeloyl-ACP methyl ester carboxylesterase
MTDHPASNAPQRGNDLPVLHHVRTPVLDIAYEVHGPIDGPPVILLHGFPYDPRAFDVVVPPLVTQGHRVFVPYLRGYGETRFLSPDTMRSGQQAALGQDLVDFMDALGIHRAAMAGYDWGGRAACIVAALWPERVRCLVTGNGYNIQDIPDAARPRSPEAERRLWYQYYMNTPRGEAGLAANRGSFCKLLWNEWSPSWRFDDATYDRSATSFDNPDFVDVVIHSYRHRYGVVAGDPALQAIEDALVSQPAIRVPTISLCGEDDGVTPPKQPDADGPHFPLDYERRLLPGVGHNLPQEAPAEVVDALTALMRRTPRGSSPAA